MTSRTQVGLNEYLRGMGLNPIDAIWGTMLDVTYLMSDFLDRGGTYENVMNAQSSYYPIPSMKVEYAGNWYLLSKDIMGGYPVMKLGGRGVNTEDMGWDTFLVHPDHLDATLCHLLEVPTNEDQVR